jgi:diaminohydroxyphosphoribosylaminopyrimidine deaminase/5-amino-6-(5-phosphoribosylamino)uracil reductase
MERAARSWRMSAVGWDEFDHVCMARALELAEQGQGQVSPNPPVGCVLAREGEVIAEGWHDHLGDLHAEQAAIADAEANGIPTQGATAYVTLEPCNHHGRTPPCTEALLWAGVGKVVIAAEDGNPTVRGGGVDYLRNAGIDVRQGLMEAEARQQMAPFMRWCERRRPLVTMKAAIDRNGRVDSEHEAPGRFTSEESLDEVHELRRRCDAVVVGVNTVIRDNPQLTVRRVPLGEGKQPLRIILDRGLRTPTDCNLVSDAGETIIFHSVGESSGLRAEVVCLHSHLGSSEEGVDLVQLLDMLGDRGIQRLMVEGGPDVWCRFLDAGLVDEVYLFKADVDLGEGLDGGINAERLKHAGLTLAEETECGDDRLQIWR